MKNYMDIYGKLIHQTGYNVIPIQPGTKKPGQWRPEGWSNMTDWSRFCREKPADGTVHIWSQWPGCGVGIANQRRPKRQRCGHQLTHRNRGGQPDLHGHRTRALRAGGGLQRDEAD